MQNGYREAKVLNNWKCHLSMSSQVGTQAHSIASTFTGSKVDRSELQLNMPSSRLVRKQRSPASDEGCRIDIATYLTPFSTFLFLSGGGRLAVHVDSVEGDFFGLPDGHFARAARRVCWLEVP